MSELKALVEANDVAGIDVVSVAIERLRENLRMAAEKVANGGESPLYDLQYSFDSLRNLLIFDRKVAESDALAEHNLRRGELDSEYLKSHRFLRSQRLAWREYMSKAIVMRTVEDSIAFADAALEAEQERFGRLEEP